MVLPLRLSLPIAALVVAPLAAAATPAGAAPPANTSWFFRVLLDDEPIGTHSFSAGEVDDGGERALVSEAAFAVRRFGITLYRYQHRAVERWRGGCLAALSADTNDNGTRTRVNAQAQGQRFDVTAPQTQSADGCVMSFAYWHPALRTQQRLLNAQTGRIEPVTITSIGAAAIEVGERRVPASGWRIQGAAQPIDVWYSAQGDWIGLDARVDGGRMLRYRRP